MLSLKRPVHGSLEETTCSLVETGAAFVEAFTGSECERTCSSVDTGATFGEAFTGSRGGDSISISSD